MREKHMAWPPRDRELPPESVMPAFNVPLKPTSETDYELLLGIRATKEGYLVRRGLQVGYTVEGKEYSDFVPAILAICTSPDLEDEHGWCPLPEEWSELKDS